MKLARWLSVLRPGFLAGLHLLTGLRIQVTGPSMMPSLLQGDHLLVSRLSYRFGKPHRGDIVVLKPHVLGPASPECIKRIVGLPHEQVRINVRKVIINGRVLSEPYALPSTVWIDDALLIEPVRLRTGKAWILGAGEYVVLGDNRAFSIDSSEFGPLKRQDIVGRAWYRYSPRGRTGWLRPSTRR